jgi:hypothetical protein
VNRFAAIDSKHSLDAGLPDRQTRGHERYRKFPAHRRLLQHGPFLHPVLQPTLFGAIALERHWGRIGTRGRHASRLFDTPEEADAALRAQVKRRFRRGYTRTDGRH